MYHRGSRFKLNLENNYYMNFVLVRINLLVALSSTSRSHHPPRHVRSGRDVVGAESVGRTVPTLATG